MPLQLGARKLVFWYLADTSVILHTGDITSCYITINIKKIQVSIILIYYYNYFVNSTVQFCYLNHKARVALRILGTEKRSSDKKKSSFYQSE